MGDQKSGSADAPDLMAALRGSLEAIPKRCPSYFYDKAGAPWHCKGDLGHLNNPHPEDPTEHYCGRYRWTEGMGEARRA